GMALPAPRGPPPSTSIARRCTRSRRRGSRSPRARTDGGGASSGWEREMLVSSPLSRPRWARGWPRPRAQRAYRVEDEIGFDRVKDEIGYDKIYIVWAGAWRVKAVCPGKPVGRAK